MRVAIDDPLLYDGPLTGARILVVDDEDLTVRAIRRVLKSCGAKVVCCGGVAEAREAIEEGAIPFDGAVVDYQLVGQDRGTEIIELLRSGSYPCCALMITGSHDPENGRRAFQAGAEDYLLKPFDVSDFVDVMEDLVVRTFQRRSKIAGTPYDPARPSGPPFVQLEPEAHLRRVNAESVRLARPRLAVLSEQKDRIAGLANLSKREREVLGLVLKGLKNVDISRELGITTRTVKFHVRNILKKCRAGSRSELTALLWLDDPLLPPPDGSSGPGDSSPPSEPPESL